jgi:hypothetical protein
VTHAGVPGMDLHRKIIGSSQKTNQNTIIVVNEHIQIFLHLKIITQDVITQEENIVLDIRKVFDVNVDECEQNNVSHVNESIY